MTKPLLGALLAFTLAAPVQAQTTQVKFINGGTVTAFGYYVGPYEGRTGPGFTNPVILNCVDFFHHVVKNQVWTANITNLGLGVTNLTNTRFGHLANALDLYRQAAWLTTQYRKWGPGNADNNYGAIQTTIWNLFGSAPGKPTGSAYWLALAQANYTSIDIKGFSILTDMNKNNPNGQDNVNSAQEFITYNATPEPATMMLLGTGLVGLAGARRRKRKKQEEAEAAKLV